MNLINTNTLIQLMEVGGAPTRALLLASACAAILLALFIVVGIVFIIIQIIKAVTQLVTGIIFDWRIDRSDALIREIVDREIKYKKKQWIKKNTAKFVRK